LSNFKRVSLEIIKTMYIYISDYNRWIDLKFFNYSDTETKVSETKAFVDIFYI